MISSDLIAQARALSCTAVIASRGNKLRKAGCELVGPCPQCGGRDRFAIHVRRNVWNCRGCQKGGGVIDLVQHLEGVDFRRAIQILAGIDPVGNFAVGGEIHAGGRRAGAVPEPDDPERTRRSLRIWDHCPSGVRDTPAEQHLINRHVDIDQLPLDLDGVLRWHPQCPWEQATHGCMIALFTDVVTAEPKAIHRTAITPAGQKVGRMALGPINGCVIRLWSDEMVNASLVIGEGLETVLSAATNIEHCGTLLQPAWATGSAGLMASLPALSGIESLTLLVDNDATLTGPRAARECAARWSAAGCEVELLTPARLGADFNDLTKDRRDDAHATL